jgi:hypothetical protein
MQVGTDTTESGGMRLTVTYGPVLTSIIFDPSDEDRVIECLQKGFAEARTAKDPVMCTPDELAAKTAEGARFRAISNTYTAARCTHQLPHPLAPANGSWCSTVTIPLLSQQVHGGRAQWHRSSSPAAGRRVNLHGCCTTGSHQAQPAALRRRRGAARHIYKGAGASSGVITTVYENVTALSQCKGQEATTWP